MSVIVRGMEMPECCAECYFCCVGDDAVCMSANRKEFPLVPDVAERLDDCPLEEVQEDDMR